MMFKFENIVSSQRDISADYTVNAGLACFDGHFPGQPIMPAAAQLQMVDELISSKDTWGCRIHKGTNFKFLQHIIPGDIITINLEQGRGSTYTLTLSKVSNQTTQRGVIASKGVLSLLPGEGNG